MAWVTAIYVAAYAAIYSLAMYAAMKSATKIPTPQAQGLSSPTNEVGREIPVLFGTREIQSPNIVWYGDLRTTPVKKKGGK